MLLPLRPLWPRTGDADSCTRSPSYLPRHGSSRCSISCRARRGSCMPGARISSFSPQPWFVLLFPFRKMIRPVGTGFKRGCSTSRRRRHLFRLLNKRYRQNHRASQMAFVLVPLREPPLDLRCGPTPRGSTRTPPGSSRWPAVSAAVRAPSRLA